MAAGRALIHLSASNSTACGSTRQHWGHYALFRNIDLGKVCKKYVVVLLARLLDFQLGVWIAAQEITDGLIVDLDGTS